MSRRLPSRDIGPFTRLGDRAGCMNLSHAYGVPPPEEVGSRLLNRALDLGVTLLDTAAIYGFGANERLIGKAVMHRRREFTLASKLRARRDRWQALSRWLARRDHEDAGCCARAARHRFTSTSITCIASIATCRSRNRWVRSSARARWARSARSACRKCPAPPSDVRTPSIDRGGSKRIFARRPQSRNLCARYVPRTGYRVRRLFSPVARGDARGCGAHRRLCRGRCPAHHVPLRRTAPVAQSDRGGGVHALSSELGCKPAQLSLAWVLDRAPFIVPIPGTRDIGHLEENP